MNDNEFWAHIWTTIAIAMVLITAIVCAWFYGTIYIYASHGYTKTTLPGTPCVQWILPDNPKEKEE